MVMQRTDTGGFEILPEMKDAIFTISDRPKKRKVVSKKGNTLITYDFKFQVRVGGQMRTHNQSFLVFVDQFAQLMRAIGAVEEKVSGKIHFVWDDEKVSGKRIIADLIHEPDENDPEKIWARMIRIRPMDQANPGMASGPMPVHNATAPGQGGPDPFKGGDLGYPEAPEEESPFVEEEEKASVGPAQMECENRNVDANFCNKLFIPCPFYGKALQSGQEEWKKCEHFIEKIPF